MTIPAEAPLRFSPEQVLTAVKAAGPFAAPMTTKQIAEATRTAAGIPPQKGEGGRWYADVSRSLNDLVAAGKLVTSRAKRWGSTRAAAGDERHQYLVPPDNRIERFYATPEQAAEWKRKIDAIEDASRAAAVVAAEIGRTWNADVAVTREHLSEPRIQVTLTLDQVARLFGIGAVA